MPEVNLRCSTEAYETYNRYTGAELAANRGFPHIHTDKITGHVTNSHQVICCHFSEHHSFHLYPVLLCSLVDAR